MKKGCQKGEQGVEVRTVSMIDVRVLLCGDSGAVPSPGPCVKHTHTSSVILIYKSI